MHSLNRDALVIRPAEPFIRWAMEVFNDSEEEVRETLAIEPNVFLIPESEEIEVTDELLEPHWKVLFQELLEAWCTHRKSWPHPRSLAMFREWFHIEHCSLVLDRGRSAPRHDD